MADVLRPDFPDVKISEAKLCIDGSIGVGIEWYHRPLNSETDPSQLVGENVGVKTVYDSIGINANPFSEKLAITGGKEQEILLESEWRSDPRLLVDAIVRLHKEPMLMPDLPKGSWMLTFA